MMKNEFTQMEYFIIFMVWKDMVLCLVGSALSQLLCFSNYECYDPYKFSLEQKTTLIYEQRQDVTGALKIKAEVDTCHSKEETCGSL